MVMGAYKVLYSNNNNNRIQRHNFRFCDANRLQHVRSRGPGCNHVQITYNTSSAYHVQVVLHAMWCKGTAQLLSLAELGSHSFDFELYFIS